jgi:uncharacterized protein YjbI with pentapeptide repeats
MNNVSFTDCGIASVRWEGGVWEEIAFRKCIFVGRDVSIQTSHGNGSFLYEDCSFEGDEAKDGMSEAELELRCEISAPGRAKVIRCDFKRAMIYSAIEMELTDCKFHYVVLQPSHPDLVTTRISISQCKGNYLDMSERRYGTISIRNSQFYSVNMSKIIGRSVELDNISGHYDVSGSLLNNISAQKSTFIHPAKIQDLDDGWGLRILGMEVKALNVSDCTFQGTNARIVLRGDPEKRDEHGKLIPWKLDSGRVLSYASLADNITIRNTPLHHMDFTYVHAKTVTLENLTISDSDFAHSKFDKLTLKNVKLAGTLDFTDTQSKTVLTESLTREVGLNLVTDKASKIEL